jgi:hypothetical protein
VLGLAEDEGMREVIVIIVQPKVPPQGNDGLSTVVVQAVEGSNAGTLRTRELSSGAHERRTTPGACTHARARTEPPVHRLDSIGVPS